jgi:hypothetical protein
MTLRTRVFPTFAVLTTLTFVSLDAIAEESPGQVVEETAPQLVSPIPNQFGFWASPPASRGLISPFSQPLNIEAESSGTQKRARSPGMVVAGSIIIGASVIGIGPIGLGVYAFSPSGYTEGRVLGAALMGVAVLGIAGGITMIVVGAKKVPVSGASARVELSIGPANLSLQGKF